MATIAKTGHDERTATEPRHDALHVVTLSKVEQVNSTIRAFQLLAKRPVPFKAGQWLDTFLPGLPRPGGFTITSPPSLAATTPARIDLAVQKSDENPAADWLWQDESTIINRELLVRVGGSFTWPPAVKVAEPLKHVLFVAGGVGINPLISMVKHFQVMERWPDKVTFVYASKVTLNGDGEPERILFLDDLRQAVKASAGRMSLQLFLTGQNQRVSKDRLGPFEPRRINEDDLVKALGSDAKHSICYVCGVPSMTDAFVQFLATRQDMSPERVLCEKWW